jgi:hypothetical protein
MNIKKAIDKIIIHYTNAQPGHLDTAKFHGGSQWVWSDRAWHECDPKFKVTINYREASPGRWAHVATIVELDVLNGVKVLSIGDHVLFMEREEVLYYKKVAQVEQLVIDYAKEL